jgi:hypothetical protein
MSCAEPFRHLDEILRELRITEAGPDNIPLNTNSTAVIFQWP